MRSCVCWIMVALVGGGILTNQEVRAEAASATTSREQEIEQAIRDVQDAEQAVRQAMREVEYTDPECSKLKTELIEMEKRVLSLRQQLYAAVRASEAVRKAEARRREAVLRLQKLRGEHAPETREDK